jgi:hypothetical protein
MTRSAKRSVRHRPAPILSKGLYPALAPYLSKSFVARLVARSGHLFRERLYPPWVTLWGMVFQALSSSRADRAATHHIASWFRMKASARSGAYCMARRRLPLEVIEAAAKHVAAKAPKIIRPFGGRRIYVMDGSSMTLADTKGNQALCPQPSGQKPGCGFPVLHFVALMDHATGCIVDMVFGNLLIHDARLARPLWDRLKRGDILLADRGFASYGILTALKRRGIDVLVRQHQCQKHLGARPISYEDGFETRTAPTHQPDWLALCLPSTKSIRVIRCLMKNGEELVLNTLISGEAASAEALCDLYRSRWRIETMFADLKTTLRLEKAMPQSVDSAHKTLWVHALAYNLMCRLLLDVALTRNIPRNQLSLKGALDALASGLALLVDTVARAIEWVMDRIAQCLIPHRPNRNEPRVRKRRPKQFPLMNRPRESYDAEPVRGKD